MGHLRDAGFYHAEIDFFSLTMEDVESINPDLKGGSSWTPSFCRALHKVRGVRKVSPHPPLEQEPKKLGKRGP